MKIKTYATGFTFPLYLLWPYSLRTKHLANPAQMWEQYDQGFNSFCQIVASLDIIICHMDMQWGWATSSTTFNYGSSPTMQREDDCYYNWIQSKFNGSNIFGTMKISSRQG